MKTKKGFTLLEVMFAMTILAILIAGLGDAYLQSVSTSQYTNDRSRAFKSAHQTMESMMALDLDEMLLYHGQTFTQVNNRTQPNTTSLTWDGTLDAGYSAEQVSEEDISEENLTSYAPETRSRSTSGGLVVITDLKWENMDDKAYLIEVNVDEFNVHLSRVRTRY